MRILSCNIYTAARKLNRQVLEADTIAETHPQFKVVSGVLAEFRGEVRRIIEREAVTGEMAVFPIPEGILRVEDVLYCIIRIPRIHVG